MLLSEISPVFAVHGSKNYELEANWQSKSGQMLMWFPISGLSIEQDLSFETEKRTVELLERIGAITISPSVSLETNYDLTTSTETSLPTSEEVVDELPGEGLVVIKAGFFFSDGRSAMEECSSIIEDIYSNQMFHRIKN